MLQKTILVHGDLWISHDFQRQLPRSISPPTRPWSSPLLPDILVPIQSQRRIKHHVDPWAMVVTSQDPRCGRYTSGQQILQDGTTVDGIEIPFTTTWDVWNPISNGIFKIYHINWCRISSINSMIIYLPPLVSKVFVVFGNQNPNKFHWNHGNVVNLGFLWGLFWHTLFHKDVKSTTVSHTPKSRRKHPKAW